MPDSNRKDVKTEHRRRVFVREFDKLKLTRKEFATLVGVSENAVGGWYSGRINLSDDACRKCAEIFGLEATVFMPENASDQFQGIPKDIMSAVQGMTEAERVQLLSMARAILQSR